MNIESIKNKIKKLLALSQDNPSDAESFSALQKAQELMAMYKLEELDLTEEEKKKCIQKRTTLSYGTRSSDHYLSDLAEIVSSNFCCVDYISRAYGTRTNYVCLMGMEDDVSIAEEVMHAANMAIIRGYNKVYKEMCKEYEIDYIPARFFNPAKTGYIKGYLSGLKHALDSQKEKHQEWGLVLVVPEEAQNFKDNLDVREFFNRDGVDNTYYNDGYSDGSNFKLTKKIGDKTPIGMIK